MLRTVCSAHRVSRGIDSVEPLQLPSTASSQCLRITPFDQQLLESMIGAGPRRLYGQRRPPSLTLHITGAQPASNQTLLRTRGHDKRKPETINRNLNLQPASSLGGPGERICL